MAEKKPSIEEIIKKSVNAAVRAAQQAPKDAYKATEKRLYALPYLKQKCEDDRELYQELLTYGPRQKSKSIVRFQKNGVALTPDEIFSAIKQDMEATIAADEEEINAVERAIATIQGDRYEYCVTGRYFEETDDETIGQTLGCDTSTVWRNRKRLVQRIAIMLYGARAVRYFDIANKAGVVSGCETYDGYVRFFSKRIPEANIQATVILFSKGGGSGGSVGAGQGLKFDDEGNLAVHIGDGLAFDKNEALTVSKETVMTSDDLVDESDVNQAVEDIFNGDGT